MFFTIEAYEFLLGFEGSYRLKRNGEWLKQEDFHKYDKTEDMIFSSFQDAIDWLKSNKEVVIEGKKVSTIPPEEISLFDTDNKNFEIIVHREEAPKHLFTLEDINNVLLNGDDRVNNSLIIDLNGYPKLIQLENYEPILLDQFAVRFETFCSGNQYVGSEISIQDNEDLYKACLEAWLLHLQTGRSIYRDYTEGKKTIIELIDEINRQIKKFSA